MASTSLVRVLLARWSITIGGLLASVLLAALAFTLAPPEYSSSGTAVLIPPRLGANGNPMLRFDSSLNTTAQILVQTLNSPEVAAQAGAAPGRDKVTVKNGGTSDLKDDGTDRPFITVTAQSQDGARAASIVAQVMSRGQDELAEQQRAIRVYSKHAIELRTIIETASPKAVLTATLRIVGAVLVLGMALTVSLACVVDKRARRQKEAALFRIQDIELATTVRPPALVERNDQPAAVLRW